jgi:hypothetical protein
MLARLTVPEPRDAVPSAPPGTVLFEGIQGVTQRMFSSFSLFSSVYLVMLWSVFNDHQRTMVLQTVLVVNIVLIARATPSDAHEFMPRTSTKNHRLEAVGRLAAVDTPTILTHGCDFLSSAAQIDDRRRDLIMQSNIVVSCLGHCFFCLSTPYTPHAAHTGRIVTTIRAPMFLHTVLVMNMFSSLVLQKALGCSRICTVNVFAPTPQGPVIKAGRSLFPRSAELAAKFCRFVYAMVDGYLIGQTELVAAGVLDALLSALRSHVASPEVQVFGCRAITAVIAGNGAQKTAFAAAAGLGIINIALTTHVSDAAVQGAGLETLATLVKHHPQNQLAVCCLATFRIRIFSWDTRRIPMTSREQ